MGENEVLRDPNIKIVDSLTSSARVAILSKSGHIDNEKNIYHRDTKGTEKTLHRVMCRRHLITKKPPCPLCLCA